MSSELLLSSLRRRMRAMHSLYEQAVETMDLNHVNHVAHEGVLPIAFSLFHFVHIEDGSSTMLGAGDFVWNEEWESRLGLSIPNHGKEKTVDEMVHQRIGDYDAYVAYQTAVFAKTENWLANLDPATLDDVIIARPLPEGVASTYSARVADERGITRLDGTECWIYQHGLRHMGEIEHARALVGLGGMTS